MKVKVLVPVDGSENSLKAVRYAAERLVHHPDYDVTLLAVACYATPWISEEIASMEEIENTCVTHYKLVLDKAKEIFTEKGLQVSTAIVTGDPAEEICSYVGKNDMDKIIMGTRGLGDFAGVILGSVSHKVLSMCKVPITIIK